MANNEMIFPVAEGDGDNQFPQQPRQQHMNQQPQNVNSAQQGGKLHRKSKRNTTKRRRSHRSKKNKTIRKHK